MAGDLVVTFDCYGTLIKWLEGLTETFARILADKGSTHDPVDFLARLRAIHARHLAGEYRSYAEQLRRSLADTLAAIGLPFSERDGDRLVEAVPRFAAFADVRPALERIRQRHRIAIISNTDDVLIAGAVSAIGVPFDAVITAERARHYKPDPAIFAYALETLGCAARDVVHVAAGVATDLAPAHALGWRRVWVNRRGEVGPAQYQPYVEIPDLSTLPEHLDQLTGRAT